MALQLAAHQQVELLVRASEFDIGFERHRIVALRDGIEQLVHGNRLLFLEALVEVFPLEHLRDRELCRQLYEAFVAKLAQPFAIEPHLGLVAVEDLEDLGLIGFGVLVDLLAAERRARRCASGRIADEPGEVADEENDSMTHVLKVLELANEHGVAQMQVGRSRIEARLYPHRFAALPGFLQTLAQIALADDLGCALAQIGELLVYGKERSHKK